MATTPRYCVNCGTLFDAYTTGVYCGPACRKAGYERPAAQHPIIACIICGSLFERFNKHAKLCSPTCREKYKYAKRSGKDRTPKGVKPPTTVAIIGIPCASCKRGDRASYSDTGWICTAYLAAACKPLGPSPVYYQPLDTTPTP